MGRFKKICKDKCPEEYALIRYIRKFEKKCNSRYYKRYADHTRNVLESIILRNGDWSDM